MSESVEKFVSNLLGFERELVAGVENDLVANIPRWKKDMVSSSYIHPSQFTFISTQILVETFPDA